MKRIETTSGAVYLWDTDNKRVVRVIGEYNPGIIIPNGEWVPADYARVVVGASAVFQGRDSHYRVTTPVVSVEDVDDDSL